VAAAEQRAGSARAGVRAPRAPPHAMSDTLSDTLTSSERRIADAGPTKQSTGQEDVVRELTPGRRVKVSELWTGWNVAKILAIRDLKVKYKQSILGPAWLILQPLGVLTGLIFVFNGVVKVNTAGVPYALFALGSISAWTFVQQAISSGTNSFVTNVVLVRRVAFPRTSLLTATLLSNLVPSGVILSLGLVGLAIDRGFQLQILLLPLVGVWFIVLLAGVLCVTASLTVRIRDTMALVPFWLQVGLFLTPVGFPLSSAPSTLKTLLSLNPLTGILETWRWCLFGLPVATLPLIAAAVGTAVFFYGGWKIFTRLEPSFADFI
jgi:ABC-type polysaccharide/polyol phosphate export permease